MSINKQLQRLRTNAWITAGARYNAARRFQRRSRFSLITISLLSALGVFAPFVLTGERVAVFSAFLAMLVLVVGIVEGASEFSSKAAALFINAEELNSFQSALGVKDSLASVSECELVDYDREYQQIKRRSQLNHEPIDLERFKLQHALSDEFKKDSGGSAFGVLSGIRVLLCYGLHSIWWLMALWLVALAGLACVILCAN